MPTASGPNIEKGEGSVIFIYLGGRYFAIDNPRED
jgi:hypothetical protein